MDWKDRLSRLDFARLDVTLFTVGDSAVTLGTVLGLLAAVLTLLVVARWLRRRVLAALLARSPLDAGTRQTVATLLYYIVLVTGFAAIMQNAGLRLSAFSVLAGAIGVGIGFGLQNIVSNFISGLIVMFERPVRVGDRIEIGGIEGDVVAINARSTLLATPRGAAAIVPNQKFITEYVRNWAYPDGTTSLLAPVKLAREQDYAKAQEVLAGAAAALGVSAGGRAPLVHCTALDGGGCLFEVQVFVAADALTRAGLQSRLLLEIERRLAAAGLRLA